MIISTLIIAALTVFQLVAVFLGRTIALEAARDGADRARISPVDVTGAAQRATAYTRDATGAWLSHVDADGRSDGNVVRVTVNAEVASFVPFVTMRISQTAAAPIERIRP
ncbi:hypothetical protein L3Q65_18060 [Amycolatopsis sp. FU40]|uniref:hypothetical protein n=1 Tax=Amycolatopsis sp. FU40 TaxID=2914159 RepID=UPI001F3D3853|nr:hypothetical protein [Amycolatopsis sp. FU40]UKD58543.1 hypothetical protein L3Q65_18060 [Amycolatopsis sp. FU40]